MSAAGLSFQRRPIRVAITSGDPNGIGPEVALKAAARALGLTDEGYGEVSRRNLALVLVGPRTIWRHALQVCHWQGTPPPEVDALATPGPDARPLPLPPLSTWDPAMAPAPRIRPGKVAADAARSAYASIVAAASAAMNGHVNAMVTAPINKEAFHLAGIREPGHTELLAHLTHARRYAMMLFGRRIRVVLATRHVPISQVPRALTEDALEEAILLLAQALPWMGFAAPRIGVCALNPHAGDGGAIGTEEQTLIAPALARLRKKLPPGVALEGPIPADAIFYRHWQGDFQAVVAMYHDQGLGPLKMASFNDGVNLTLGLPIIRTSPDHGTAFDLAGRGLADPRSTLSALRWAIRLARRPNPWA